MGYISILHRAFLSLCFHLAENNPHVRFPTMWVFQNFQALIIEKRHTIFGNPSISYSYNFYQ